MDTMKGRRKEREGEAEGEGGREGAGISVRQTSGCFTMTFLGKNFLFEKISGVNSTMFDRKINP